MKTSHEMAQSVLKRQKKILRRRKAVLTALSAAAGVCAIAGAVILSPTLFPRQGVNLVDSQSPADSAFETKKPLELLNYSANETEEYSVISFYEWETISDFSLFREYFFGTWKMTDGMEFQKGIGKESFIIDDSEKCLNFARKANLRAHDNYYKVSENVLAFTMNSNAEGYLFWLDTNQPDTLYCIPYYPSHVSFKPFVSISGNAEPAVYKKTSAPINEPQNGFLSVYRLYELSREYGIDFDMLVNIEYDDKSGEMLYHDDRYQFYPMYLVSEAPEKLVLNTLLGNVMAAAEEVEVNITFEKIGGVWKRNVALADGGLKLTGLFGEEIDKSLITQINCSSGAVLSPDELTLNNWHYITCEGFAYAAEPSTDCYTSIDNSDIWNAAERKFEGVGINAQTEYRRVVPGDKVCGLTVKKAATHFSPGYVQSGFSRDIPGIYLAGCEVEFEGTVEMTGYICIAPEDDYNITAGDIAFVPATGNAKLPVVKFDRLENGEIVNRMVSGGTNDFSWYNEYHKIYLGNTAELDFDITDIPAEWKYHKVKIVVDSITAKCDIGWETVIKCNLVSLEPM